MREDVAPIQALTTIELVTMVATLSALNALSIDIMLPALPDIGEAFRLPNANDRQLVISVYIAAFGLSQLVYGPLADAFGRRRVLIGAVCLFIVASLVCVAAPSFGALLAARAAQGLGAGAARVIAIAVVRDLTSGRTMAQIMSMAMTVFMIAPIVAPGLGQLILFVAPWRWIFGALLLYALVVLAWALLRLPETLAPKNRRPFALKPVFATYLEILSNRQTFGYTIAAGLIAGGLFGYIIASEQIYVDVFDLGPAFPIAFAALAIVMSFATMLNAALVGRLGMKRIAFTALGVFIAAASLNALLAALGVQSLWVFMGLMALSIGGFGLVSGNFNALAMQPAAKFAGSAAAIFGAATSVLGGVVGAIIARGFDGTTTPFLIGLALVGVLTLATAFWCEAGQNR